MWKVLCMQAEKLKDFVAAMFQYSFAMQMDSNSIPARHTPVAGEVSFGDLTFD